MHNALCQVIGIKCLIERIDNNSQKASFCLWKDYWIGQVFHEGGLWDSYFSFHPVLVRELKVYPTWPLFADLELLGWACEITRVYNNVRQQWSILPTQNFTTFQKLIKTIKQREMLLYVGVKDVLNDCFSELGKLVSFHMAKEIILFFSQKLKS